MIRFDLTYVQIIFVSAKFFDDQGASSFISLQLNQDRRLRIYLTILSLLPYCSTQNLNRLFDVLISPILLSLAYLV